MKKLTIGMLLVLSSMASAEVTCTAVRNDEALEVKIIDTFIERVAFVKRTHPTLSIPDENIGVLIEEKSQTVNFVNIDKGFSLEIERSSKDGEHASSRKGLLTYGEIFTVTNCIVE